MPTYNNSYTSLVGAIIVALLLTSCAAPKVKQNVLMPANSPGLQKAKKVAILKFSGDKNEEFSNKLETFFSTLKVKNKPYFTVIDQNVRDSILTERKIQIENGQLAGADAVNFGKLSGADTLISGLVKWPKFVDVPYKEKRNKCVKKATKKSRNALGLSYYKCLQYQDYMVNCTTMKGEFSFTIKAASVQTGEIVHSKNYKANAEDKHCSDSGVAKKDAAELERTVVKQAIAQMRRDVAPYLLLVTIELMEDDDSDLSKNKRAEQLLESGIEFAENNRMQRACSLFDQASKSYQFSPAIYHNLGVCAEMKKDFDLAENMYKKADSLLLKPEKLINTALVRVSERKLKEKQVQAQLR
ncbi:MAG: hypothetical protein ACC707_12615 [Thiohalomonadales bacterium]